MIEVTALGAEPRRALRFAPRPGTEEVVAIRTRMEVRMARGESAMPERVIPPQRITLKVDVKQVEPGGDISYAFGFTRVEAEEADGVEPRVLALMRSQLKSLEGITGEVKTSRRGVAHEAEISLPPAATPQVRRIIEGLEQSLAQFSAPVPEPAVGVGASWKVTTEIRQSGLTFEQTATYRILEMRGPSVKLGVTVSQTAPAEQRIEAPGLPAGTSVTLLSLRSRGRGTTHLRLDRVMPLEARVEMESETRVRMEDGDRGEELTTRVHSRVRLAQAARPNVLCIAIDDLNDWIGCLGGHPQAKTPHMDRLARSGTLFLNAHCQSPLCNPSRTSLLTGLRPSTTGVYALNPWFRSSKALAGHVTLPQHFQARGYRTMTTGKVYHDAYPPRADRRDGGPEFDEWGYHGNFGPLPETKLVRTPEPHPLVDWGIYPETDEEQEDWKVGTWAVNRLKALGAAKRRADQHQEKIGDDSPFFLCVGFRRPHVPCFASKRWFDLYPEESLEMPPVREDDRADTPRFSWYLHWKLPEPRLAWLRRAGEWRPLVRAYLASISFVDSQVGRVLDALDAARLTESTVIVLWSDHGWHLGEKGISGKNTLWDRSTRVPLIFSGPGIPESARSTQPAELLDVYPTLAELCGLPTPEGLDGHSLVPQIQDPATPRPWPAITTHGPGNHGIRTEGWRYIRYADGSEELYDMRSDPHEWTNLATDPTHAERRRAMARWVPGTSAAPLPGSRPRLIEIRDGVPHWEGKPIGPDDPIPMDEE